MQRRNILGAVAGLGGTAALGSFRAMGALGSLAGMGTSAFSATVVQNSLKALKPSSLMPALFVGHGSPMNAIEDGAWRRGWQSVGAELMRRAETPQLILCISAHWLTRDGWQITGMAQPRTIHDFGGFPAELHAQQYPAPGAPAVAATLARELRDPANGRALQSDATDWGYDHGAWSVLKPMFPKAVIPVLQLSMDFSRPVGEHYAMGRQLRGLRQRGVLIVGSGNIVHNLRATRRDAPDNHAYDWAREFDAMVGEAIAKGNLDALQKFQDDGSLASMAHPTYDHFLPLLYAAGAVSPQEMPRFFNAGFQSASISMRSVIWG